MEPVEFRRRLHAHPELSFKEHDTAAFIEQQLDELGIEHRRIASTGVVARIKGRKTPEGDRRAAVLRADIDALPVTERNDCEWRSQNEGVMHACGHDMHAAVLFGVSENLRRGARFPGHALRAVPAGRGVQPGRSLAGAGRKAVRGLRRAGRRRRARRTAAGGRAPSDSAPESTWRQATNCASASAARAGTAPCASSCKDPVAAGAELLTRLIALNGEECVLSIGRVEAGGATNIVPDEIYMEGTLRTFDERERGIIHRRIEIIAADIDARHGVKTEVTIGRGYPCVVNDEILVKQATALAKAEKLKVEMLPLRTTAEDFGFYCKQYPSLFYRLGVGAAAGRPHTATFFPDEAAIGVGIAYMRKLALQLLEK